MDTLQTSASPKECNLCIFQRDGSAGNIIYRSITDQYNGPEEETFGHCFFCLTCAGVDDIPCYGWWPADPDGGDFEGDNGSLHPDAKEYWKSAQCVSITEQTAESLMNDLDSYEQEHTYQVLNWGGGTSCLGFCDDVLQMSGIHHELPFGDLTISGDLHLTTPTIFVQNTDESPPTALMETLNRPIINHSRGMLWNQEYYQSHTRDEP